MNKGVIVIGRSWQHFDGGVIIIYKIYVDKFAGFIVINAQNRSLYAS